MAWLPSGSLKGPQGIDGIQGPAGIQGLPGADGAAGTQGVPGEAGPQGEHGVAGEQGIQGIQGAAGTGINFRGQVATVADLPAGAAPCISKEVRSYQRNQGVQPMNNETDLRRQISW